MKTFIRKLSGMIAMLMIAFMVVPMTVSAEESEKVAVYVQTPEDWENPCVWAWDDDGNNAFEAWPGGETEADPANEGWSYIWIPAWANHVIVNANEGSVQTEEILLEGKNAWITVTAADAYEVSYDQLTTGDIPEYVEKFVVHAQVDTSWENPCLWAWSAPDGTNAFDAWPGYAMKDDGDGWYSAKVPVWVNSIIVNGNEGSVQTADISIDPAELWVTVDAEGTYDFSYVDPNKAAIPDVTVHVMAPADWSTPCLWAWSAPDGTNVYTTWPGEALEEGENGWLTKTIPGWVNSVIVNGNEGSVQTTDITVEAGKDIWLVVTDGENFELTYEEPVVEAAAEEAVTEAAEAEEETSIAAAEETVENEEGGNGAVIAVIVVVLAAVAGGAVVVAKKNKK